MFIFDYWAFHPNFIYSEHLHISNHTERTYGKHLGHTFKSFLFFVYVCVHELKFLCAGGGQRSTLGVQ